MYRVEIEPRSSCISEMICVVLCPEVFLIEPDGLAAIRPEYRSGAPHKGEVPRDLERCIQAAAENCPVEIIRYTDTGSSQGNP